MKSKYTMDPCPAADIMVRGMRSEWSRYADAIFTCFVCGQEATTAGSVRIGSGEVVTEYLCRTCHPVHDRWDNGVEAQAPNIVRLVSYCTTGSGHVGVRLVPEDEVEEWTRDGVWFPPADLPKSFDGMGERWQEAAKRAGKEQTS